MGVWAKVLSVVIYYTFLWVFLFVSINLGMNHIHNSLHYIYFILQIAALRNEGRMIDMYEYVTVISQCSFMVFTEVVSILKEAIVTFPLSTQMNKFIGDPLSVC